MNEDIIHPGNSVSIECSRCAIDAIKYSRVVSGENSSPNEEKGNQFQTKIKKENSKLQPLSEISLDSGNFLYISKEPSVWFIGTKEIKKRLSQGINGLNEEDLKFLYGKSVLEVEGKIKPIEILKGRYVARTDNTSLISITDRCNLTCGHCVANANQNRLGQEIGTGELEAVLRTIAMQKNPLGLDVEKKIFLTGGEPLIRKDLAKLARTACEYGLSTHICTNGLKITSDFLMKIRDLPVSFLVSYDGTKENHERIRGIGTYNVTIKHIKDIVENGNDLFLNNFLHRDNFSDIEHVVDFASEVGARGVNFIRAIPRGRGKGMDFQRVPDKFLFSKIYELMMKDSKYYSLLENENTFSIMALSAVSGIKSLNCGLARENYFFLDSGGNIFPCPGTRYDEFKMGNIRKDSLEELMLERTNHPLASLRVDEFPVCSKCDYTFFCGGDCRGSAYGNSQGKDIKAPVPYCNERKDSLNEMFNVLSLNSNFMKNKSRRIIENAREETRLYEKS